MRAILRAALLALVAVSCTRSGPQALDTSDVPTSKQPPSSPQATSGPTSMALSVHAAGYRLAAPVERAVAVGASGVVYIAGGLDTSGTSVSGVFQLDPGTGKLTQTGNLPQPVHDAAGSIVGGKLAVFGGGSSVGTDLVQTFNPATDRASITGHLPVALSDLAAATVGGTPYLVGGYDGSQPRREIYATTDGRTFQIVARMPVGLRYPAVTAVGSTIVIAGGETAGGLSDAVYAFDTAGGNVRTLGHLPAPVAHAAAFTLGRLAFVAGGRNRAGRAVASTVVIDPRSGSVHAATPLPQPVADVAVAGTTASTLLIGGWRGSAIDQIMVATLDPAAGISASARSSATPPPAVASAAAAARPFAGLLLIADRGNNRLLVMNAKKHIVWRYPSPSLPPPSARFYFPDDAFWVHHGHAILVNEEENNLLAEIAYPSGRTLWTYGHAGVAGSSAGYLHQPDDVYPYPGGGVVVADAKNCRILFLGPAGNIDHQIGTIGICTHGFPGTVGYPNGDTPLPDGHLLISEINGGWIDEVTGTGQIVRSYHVPEVAVPSDPQRLPDGSYLVASYDSPGAIVRFDRSGKVLWSYRVATGPGALDHPSLAVRLPNGLVAVNDDYNHRVLFIDPATKRIVWHFGTGVSGAGPGQLSYPDGMDLMLPGDVTPLHVDFTSPTIIAGRP